MAAAVGASAATVATLQAGCATMAGAAIAFWEAIGCAQWSVVLHGVAEEAKELHMEDET